jgi:IS5 family transposase
MTRSRCVALRASNWPRMRFPMRRRSCVFALLERHQLTERIFTEIRSLLEEKRLLLKSGTIVDATIIEAPPSTKNEQRAHDPEMRQRYKGGGWHFGMKAHIGTDVHGRVHSLATTHAGTADIPQLPKLLHGNERALYGDQAYWSADHRQAAEAKGIRYRPSGHALLSTYQRAINRSRSRTRARAEDAFHIVKCLWGFTKVRYRGLAKNTARLFTAFALANLYLRRRRLMPPGERCLC